tara:strand:+ start:4662 stop:5069 length:408 start_codon:yes stop_codon:yes gene_type:complete
MKITGIEHIAIAVNSITESSPFWLEILGLSSMGRESVESEGVNTEFYQAGKSKIELLEKIGENSPIAKFLEKRGEGIHHICFEVENIDEAIKELKEKNIELLSDLSKEGTRGKKIIFIHPRSAGGVLVELAEKDS